MRESVFEYCTIAQLGSIAGRPAVFLAIDTLITFSIICTMLWTGWIATLNVAGLVYALVTGEWRLKQIYDAAYFPIAATIWVLGALGKLPRVKPSTKGEGDERRYFYGMAWAAPIAQGIVMVLWLALPRGFWGDVTKLVVFVAVFAYIASLAVKGVLPRTRKIVPGELAISD